jgi:hypothetical protein
MNALSELARRSFPGVPQHHAGQNADGAVIPSQNALRRSTRRSGTFPAMIAALIAPIEMPATQSGKYSDVDKASYTPA